MCNSNQLYQHSISHIFFRALISEADEDSHLSLPRATKQKIAEKEL